MNIEFKSGIPEKDGWYLVKLVYGYVEHGQPYDVDYCRAKSSSDGGGREWCEWYSHNISGWAELPSYKKKEAENV